MSDTTPQDDFSIYWNNMFNYFYEIREFLIVQNASHIPIDAINAGASVYISLVHTIEKQVVDDELWKFLRDKCTFVYSDADITGKMLFGFKINIL